MSMYDITIFAISCFCSTRREDYSKVFKNGPQNSIVVYMNDQRRKKFSFIAENGVVVKSETSYFSKLSQ